MVANIVSILLDLILDEVMEEEIRLIIQNLGISIGANLLYDIGKKIVKLLPTPVFLTFFLSIIKKKSSS